jgi:hypothetical protein
MQRGEFIKDFRVAVKKISADDDAGIPDDLAGIAGNIP